MASICLMAHSDFKPVCAQVRHDKLKLQFWNAVTAFVTFIATTLLDHAEHAELTNVRHAQFQVFRDTLFQSHSPVSRHVYFGVDQQVLHAFGNSCFWWLLCLMRV